jgi:plasmid maintenance system antidote protein VapI
MKDQLIKIMTHFNLTATRFADEIGVQRSSISHILSGRNKPSYDFILRLIEKYPSLNPSWLLTGKGNMLQSEENNRTSSEAEMVQQAEMFVPDNEMVSKNSSQSKKEPKHIVDRSKQHEEITNVNDLDSVILLFSDGTFFQYSNRNEDKGRIVQ